MENRINYDRHAALLKALANPVRLQIVRGLLLDGCRNVGCMERETGVSQSCISQHLQKLRAAGVVEAARRKNEVFYRVSSRTAAELMATLWKVEAEDNGQ